MGRSVAAYNELNRVRQIASGEVEANERAANGENLAIEAQNGRVGLPNPCR